MVKTDLCLKYCANKAEDNVPDAIYNPDAVWKFFGAS
jgi:hypothetical protein